MKRTALKVGYRGHESVVWAVKVCEDMMLTSPTFKKRMEKLQRTILKQELTDGMLPRFASECYFVLSVLYTVDDINKDSDLKQLLITLRLLSRMTPYSDISQEEIYKQVTKRLRP